MIQSFFNTLKKRASEAGLEAVELFYQNSHAFSAKVFRAEMEKYQVSEESGISVRGLYQGKVGYYYSERIDETVIDPAIEAIKAGASLIEMEGERLNTEAVALTDDGGCGSLPDRQLVMDVMFDNEEKLKGAFEEIEEVPYNLYSEIESETVILNSYGMTLSQKNKLYYYVLSGLARRGDKSKTALKYMMGQSAAFNSDSMIREVGEEAVALLAAEPVVSGVYDMILRRDVAADLIGAFSGIFSGEALEKGITPLKDSLDKQIGAAALTIVDDPEAKGAPIQRTFDDEGVPTRRKVMVDAGVLKEFLHNTRTAEKLGVDQTGNGQRSSIKSLVGISHTNLYVQPGEASYETLISNLDDGIVIIDVQALHSGLNAISGDFSLPAQGYRVQEGKITGAVDQITISGNVLQLFESVEQVGSDLFFDLPGGLGSVGSPSMLIRGISVAGK